PRERPLRPVAWSDPIPSTRRRSPPPRRRTRRRAADLVGAFPRNVGRGPCPRHRELERAPHDGRLLGPELQLEAHETRLGLPLANPSPFDLVFRSVVGRVAKREPVATTDPLEL